MIATRYASLSCGLLVIAGCGEKQSQVEQTSRTSTSVSMPEPAVKDTVARNNRPVLTPCCTGISQALHKGRHVQRRSIEHRDVSDDGLRQE